MTETAKIVAPVEAFAQAVEIATSAHAGQRTAVGDPYILHPIRVALALRADGFSLLHQTVAVLHDVVEDTPLTLDKIRSWFGDDVARALDAVTRREGESYVDFVARAAADPVGGYVKLYDVRDNFGRLHELRHDHAEFAARLLVRYSAALGQLEEFGVR